MRKTLASLKSNIGLLVRLPSIEPTGPEPPVPQDDLPDSVRPETIEAMLDNVRRLVEYEEQRLNSLTTRGSGLAGLSGLATAVLSAAGGDVAFPLSSKILFAIAIAGLAFSVGAVVLGMLTARGGSIQSTRQLKMYMDPAYQSVSPARVNFQILDSLIRRLEGLRNQNRVRAAWLNRSALALAASIALAALAAVIRFFA